MKKILITYASKYGATAEIADRIGKEISYSGFQTEIMPVNQVHDIEDFDTVILGSAVYMGQWRKDAIRFLKKYAEKISQKRLWVFSSGPVDEGDPVELLQGWMIPKKIRSLVEVIKPIDIKVFHGKIEINQLNFFERWILNKVKSPAGDFRDWKEVKTWALKIAGSLK